MANRINCPMRHENGNCLPIGGFCTAVSDEICEGLHNLYEEGKSNSIQHGYWYYDGEDPKCSCCELSLYNNMVNNAQDWGYFDPLPDYCPNCGARMDGEER